jgi:hypothetical protein
MYISEQDVGSIGAEFADNNVQENDVIREEEVFVREGTRRSTRHLCHSTRTRQFSLPYSVSAF